MGDYDATLAFLIERHCGFLFGVTRGVLMPRRIYHLKSGIRNVRMASRARGL
jgi:hypothetical protein